MEPPKPNGNHPNHERETARQVVDFGKVIDELEEIVGPIDAKYSDFHRAAYLSEHAPGILAALIIRRASTEPEHLVQVAVRTTGLLYDALKSSDTT